MFEFFCGDALRYSPIYDRPAKPSRRAAFRAPILKRKAGFSFRLLAGKSPSRKDWCKYPRP